MTDPSYALRLAAHSHDLDADGHDTVAGGGAPNVVYAECNTGPVGGGVNADFDTFYDKTRTAIGSGAVAASLATLGLTYSAATFTATEDVLLALVWGVDILATPAGSSTPGVRLWTPDYTAPNEVRAPNPNTVGTWTGTRTVLIQSGEVFYLFGLGSDAAYDPISYASLSIIRLV